MKKSTSAAKARSRTVRAAEPSNVVPFRPKAPGARTGPDVRARIVALAPLLETLLAEMDAILADSEREAI